MDRRIVIAIAAGGVFALAALAMVMSEDLRQPVILAANTEPLPVSVAVPEEPDSEFTRPSLQHFTDSVSDTLFSSGPPPRVAERAKPVRRVAATTQHPRVESSSDSFDGFIYSGMARIGATLLALIEDPVTRRGQFVRVGDWIGGGHITSIRSDHLTVRIEGRAERLDRNQKYSLVPLNRSADFLATKTATSATPATPTAAPAAATQPQPATVPAPILQTPIPTAVTAPVPAPPLEPQTPPGEKAPSPNPAQPPAPPP